MQVLVGSAHKFGNVKSSVTLHHRQDIQTFDFNEKEFKNYFIAQIVYSADGEVDALLEKHYNNIGLTPTIANDDDAGLKYDITNYQKTFCDHIDAGIARYELHHIISADHLPQIDRKFFRMDCKAFKMGVSAKGRSIIGLILNYKGNITASQDPKHFEPTTLNVVTLPESELGHIKFNNSIGHLTHFQVLFNKDLKGITLEMQILLTYDSMEVYDGNLESINELNDFIFSNTTKTIFNYVGDHVIGQDKVTGFEIIASKF